MQHPSVIDTDIGRCLRRSLSGDRRVQLFPDHFERRRITGQVRQRGLPLVANRFLLFVRESVVQINGEPIVFTLRVEGGPHVGKVDRDRIGFEQLIEIIVVTGGPALPSTPKSRSSENRHDCGKYSLDSAVPPLNRRLSPQSLVKMPQRSHELT